MPRVRPLALAFVVPLLVARLLGQAPAPSQRSVLDGVYSEPQAKKGEATYIDKCSECHDDGLMGPELRGPEFLGEWKTKNVEDLYTRIMVTMPASDPGSLKAPQALGIVAYLLWSNGFPSGDKALDDPTALKTITFSGNAAIPLASNGKPSLEGIWNFSTLTPLERSANVQGRSTFTAAEAAVFEQQQIERHDYDRRGNGAASDLNGAYNGAWYDYGTTLAVVGGVKPTSLIVDPPDGRIPALTPDGQRRAAERADARRDHPIDGPEDRSLSERCLSYNAGPPMLSAPYNNYVQIVQTTDAVVLFNEMVHDARVIPLDVRPHLPSSVRQFLGDSRGHWDHDTLVIDTTNFTDETNVRNSDAQLHLTERLTRADAGTLLYEFTIDDPTAFTKPWTAIVPMKLEDTQIYEYACHEANYALENMLRGARAEERERNQR
jgi:mono/diheme cytochrome c family protein